MKKKEERMEKQMNEVMAENKRLVEPLQRAKEEVEELRKELSNYEKDKQSLAVRTCGLRICIVFSRKNCDNARSCCVYNIMRDYYFVDCKGKIKSIRSRFEISSMGTRSFRTKV